MEGAQQRGLVQAAADARAAARAHHAAESSPSSRSCLYVSCTTCDRRSRLPGSKPVGGGRSGSSGTRTAHAPAHLPLPLLAQPALHAGFGDGVGQDEALRLRLALARPHQVVGVVQLLQRKLEDARGACGGMESVRAGWGGGRGVRGAEAMLTKRRSEEAARLSGAADVAPTPAGGGACAQASRGTAAAAASACRRPSKSGCSGCHCCCSGCRCRPCRSLLLLQTGLQAREGRAWRWAEPWVEDRMPAALMGWPIVQGS